MKIVTLREICSVGRQCEGIHADADNPEVYYVITKKVTDPGALAAFAGRVGPDEQLGTITRAILPELQS